MLQAKLHRLFFLVILMTGFASGVCGQEEHFYGSMDGRHFGDDSTLTVEDDKYGNSLWSTIQKNIKVTDIVSLELNEDTARFLIGDHTCKVDLEITYYDSAGAADSLATTLSINYLTEAAKSFNFRSSFKFNGGYKVKARILAVYLDGTLTSTLLPTFPKVFTLAEDIYINRIYHFNCSAPLSPYHTYDGTNQRLIIDWMHDTGAGEYDLEYTFYDDSSYVIRKDTMVSYTDLGFLFSGNATRVTVKGCEYAFSLVYNPGYVFYRIRPIHYDINNNRIEGTWSSAIATTIHSFGNKFRWVGHENSLNWKYDAAYAEEGKRKEVANYLDGSSRNRQSVTLNNTENKAIVGETVYDDEGRPAVTTLPAPIDSGKLWYYNKYNVDPTGAEYNQLDFDTGACAYIPVGMDSTRGSSRYYSSSNPDTLTGFDRFLPDAQGYPFVMTEYTPDNTGRVSRQSIAGKTFRFGSGHETKYYYGKPAQQELDRLFGSEAGVDSSYLENMVVDANGQISVSYINSNGKTVATALAGQLPSNLKPVGSYSSASTLYTNMLAGGNVQPSASSLSSEYSLVATNAGDYHFAYQLLPGNYTDTSCSRTHVCTDCLYDVELMVTNSCGCDSAIVLHYDSNFSYASAFDTLCGHHNIIDTFTSYLQPGEYNISRLITVDPKAINFYTSEFKRKDSCLKSYSTFLASAIANTDFSGCNMTCATCLSALGDSSAFLTKYITELHNSGETISTHQDTVNAYASYDQAKAQCNALCQPYSPCTGLYSEMLADVTLGGQYCQDTLIGSTYSAEDASSMLNPTFYQYPKTPYLNSAGVADSVVINGVKFPPQQLTVTQFVQNWNPSWAASLVGYHPEYCFYERCISDSSSNTYDYNVTNTSTYAAAASAGYLNPLGKGPYYNCSSVINNPDPYFKKGGYGQVDSTWMRNRLKHFETVGGITLNLWETVALAINRNEDTLQGMNMTIPIGTSDTVMCSICSGGENLAWSMFKGIYSSIKQHAQDSLDSVYVATTGGCSIYANCVGVNSGSCSGTIYQSKTPRHISIEYASALGIGSKATTVAGQLQYFDSAMTVHCDSTCLSYAYYWYQKLSGCGTITSTDSIRLMQGFLNVCEAGCNMNHPFGSSTTPNGIPDDSNDISFEDVIHRVLGERYSDTLCNGTLISMPPPYYDSTGLTGPMITYYKPTPCQCGNIDTAYSIYSKDSASDHTKYVNFGDFLTKYYGDSISEVNAWSIYTLCKATSCFYASAPIQMPLWLSCCQDSDKPQQVTVAGGNWQLDTVIGGASSSLVIFAAVSFSIGDSGYVIGGASKGANLSGLHIWNQIDSVWETGASESTRMSAIGASIGSRGYVGLGYNPTISKYMKDIRQYNPKTNTWITKSTSFSDTGRISAFSFAINGSIYVGCGDSVSPSGYSHDFKSFFKYDTTSGTWTRSADFPGGKRSGMVAFSINGFGYAGCGVDTSYNLYRDMWQYNPTSNSWMQVAPLPVSHGFAWPVSFVIKGKAYVGTGYTGIAPYRYTDKFWVYDPQANKWYTAPLFNGGRCAYGIGFSIGNYGYAGGGGDPIYNQFAARYADADNTISGAFDRFLVQDSAQFAAPQCCLSCANIDTAMNHFGKAYPGVNDTTPNYTTFLANYLNQYFGFDMQFNDYLQFYNECKTTDTLDLGDGKHLPLTLCNRAMNEVPAPTDTNPCYTNLMLDAQYSATEQYNSYLDSVQNTFEANYIAHCLQIDDSFHVTMPFDMYHYTLYYYDQAGNLVKTVPPQGVHPITAVASLDSVSSYRSGTAGYNPVYPKDSMQTKYFYNTLNEPIKQQTPDGDSVHYWYDRLGRICLSQNAVQRNLTYSYTQYDALNRIIEVGQVSTVPANLPSCFHCVGCTVSYGVLPVLPDTFSRNDAELQNFINTGTKTQVTHTYYDTAQFTYIPLAQQNLRKRIATISYQDVYDNLYTGTNWVHEPQRYDNAIHYSYDIEGNVASILIDVPHDTIVKQRYKKINYYYDLVSGNINQLVYEQDSIDQFIHNYEYDADDRLITVNTSQDSLFFEQDASYEYYDHGPLAREVIGRRQVQGLDYAYTLNGWLKGVNSSINNPSFDMGHDGDVHGTNDIVARDAYGFTLNYFNGDYRSIASTNFQASGLPITSLYNSNIAGATYSIKPLAPKTLGYIYNYDQLNRYVGDSIFKNPDTVNNNWNTRTGINDLKEKVSYDENGNILVYLRHGNTAVGPLAMDSLTYHYTKGRDQLTQVNDAVASTNYSQDVHNETSNHNYRYNGIGELAKDSAGGLDTIMWTMYGSLKEIKKHNGDSIIFFYDPLGNRLEKRYYPHGGQSDTTMYAREANGNIMAVYDRKKDTVRLTEWDIYGGHRIGSVDTTMRMQKPIIGSGSIDSLTIEYLEGQKQYELTSHTGNVLVTISDRKIPIDTVTTDTLAKYYLPVVISAQDYYPYGMLQPGRSYLLKPDSLYRFGFDGHEGDDSVYGKKNATSALYWEYSPRLNTRWNIDPKSNAFSSGYSAFYDNPILNSDPNGDLVNVTTAGGKFLFSLDDGKTEITTLTVKALYDKGIQWFEPLADNYLPIVTISPAIGTATELLHFSWDDIAKFATVDRWMVSYRAGGSGDWKASKEGGNGYYMVTINGMPYWASAVGNIPFAVNYFHDQLMKTGNYITAMQSTINTAIAHGNGQLFGGVPDNSNTVDNYFILRGALWAGQYYTSTGGTTTYSPTILGRPMNLYFKNTYLKTLKSNTPKKEKKDDKGSGSDKGKGQDFHQNPRFL